MLEDQIKRIIACRNLRPIDIYKPLKINRVNFYKAIQSSNLKNKSLIKIINYLGLELSVILNDKNDHKKRVL